jgi:hypothetical protein
MDPRASEAEKQRIADSINAGDWAPPAKAEAPAPKLTVGPVDRTFRVLAATYVARKRGRLSTRSGDVLEYHLGRAMFRLGELTPRPTSCSPPTASRRFDT